ncbi:ciliary neurotrophic factor-like, partial [Clarias magur]
MEGQRELEPGRSDTARAVALAHLLHKECTNLLDLYKERESFLSHHVPEGERLLIFDLCADTPSSAQRVGHAHSALSRCLEMLECLIAREVEELGEDFKGEYETARNTVKDRIGHLLHSTGALLENGEGMCAPLPEFQCNQ